MATGVAGCYTCSEHIIHLKNDEKCTGSSKLFCSRMRQTFALKSLLSINGIFVCIVNVLLIVLPYSVYLIC